MIFPRSCEPTRRIGYVLQVMLFEALSRRATARSLSGNRFCSEHNRRVSWICAVIQRGGTSSILASWAHASVRAATSWQERREAVVTIPPPAGSRSGNRRWRGVCGTPRRRRTTLCPTVLALCRQLEAAYADMQEGRLNVVWSDGPSGHRQNRARRSGSCRCCSKAGTQTRYCCGGRCYEFESVPYKGLDAAGFT